ncbi:MAG: sorbosone dehydrogenase family protein [Haloglomus sp.]
MDQTRRRLLRAAAAAGAGGFAGCTLPGGGTGGDGGDESSDDGDDGGDGGGAATPTGEPSPETSMPDAVGLAPLVEGLRAPLAIQFAPGADRAYIAEQQGIVHTHEGGTLRERPFLDLRDTATAGGEKGLLGVALHPDFAENRRLYVRYSAPPRQGTPSGYSHTFVLAEFEATADGRRVNRDSERTILEIPEPQGNHNAGDLAFGPDGYLYVAVGDGGAGGDQGRGHADDWYDAVGGGNGQDLTENLLGSILRIDVDGRGDGPNGVYAVPEDNPLVGRAGRDEHYAWGFRNPYRMAFDGADLFAGDVGQNRYEEVDRVVKGGNYGWNVREGRHCYGADDCPDRTPGDVRGGELLRDPILEYPHSGGAVSGISVIGGQVYRGDAMPGLEGAYVFGDLQVGGRLFVATRPERGDQWPTRTLALTDGASDRLQRLLSVGRDAGGEVYVLGTGANGGGVYRLVPAP